MGIVLGGSCKVGAPKWGRRGDRSGRNFREPVVEHFSPSFASPLQGICQVGRLGLTNETRSNPYHVSPLTLFDELFLDIPLGEQCFAEHHPSSPYRGGCCVLV